MVYPYMTKFNGRFYKAGEEVPDLSEKARKEPLSEKAENPAPVEETTVKKAKTPTKKGIKKE